MGMTRSIDIRKFLAYSAIVVLLTLSMCTVGPSDAASASLSLEPSSQTVGAVGVTFTVNVSIADVSNLYGYSLKLYYNSTLMNGTQVTEGPFLKSGGVQTFFDIVNFTDHYNSTHGIVSIYSLLTGGAPGANGGGVLITVQFKSLAPGNSVPLHLADVNLSDPNSNSISYTIPSDGTVTVVPEFTSLVAILTFVAISLLVILIGKRGNRARYYRRRNIQIETHVVKY
jgi:hypothetical protein